MLGASQISEGFAPGCKMPYPWTPRPKNDSPATKLHRAYFGVRTGILLYRLAEALSFDPGAQTSNTKSESRTHILNVSSPATLKWKPQSEVRNHACTRHHPVSQNSAPSTARLLHLGPAIRFLLDLPRTAKSGKEHSESENGSKHPSAQ